YSVWNMSGVQVADGNGNQLVTVDLSAMSPDVYIIKANNKTLKFIKH
ncbi:MAG: T9SS type A sorting domain-containing protein, partial [Muribaculaceae bacterium]|nr:T9SS type A sorting domain-containing protein [Muribaculaceae bacterium]